MTVETEINSVSYDGDGVSTNFVVTYQFFGASELRVVARNETTGAETNQVLNSDYTVIGGDGEQGTVIANVPPPAGTKWTIVRDTDKRQFADYGDNDPFPAQTHEGALDRQTMIAQDAASEATRSVRYPVTDSDAISTEVPNSILRKNQFFAWGPNGEPIAAAGTSGNLGPVSTYIDGLLPQSDAASARAYLGAASIDDVNPTELPIGAVWLWLSATPPTGWLFLNGDTVGSGSSLATHQDNAYETLFTMIWDSFADTEAPVVGGRGISAAADWAANKAITLMDVRGRSVIGTGQGAGLSNRVNGVTGGAEEHTLVSSELPDPISNGNVAFGVDAGSAAFVVRDSAGTGGTILNSGGNQPHSIMNPFLALNFIVRAVP